MTKQINDLVFSWFRIGKHRVPEAVIVVGAVPELTSSPATSKSFAFGSIVKSFAFGSKVRYQLASMLLGSIVLASNPLATTCLLPRMLARGPVINMAGALHCSHVPIKLLYADSKKISLKVMCFEAQLSIWQVHYNVVMCTSSFVVCRQFGIPEARLCM